MQNTNIWELGELYSYAWAFRRRRLYGERSISRCPGQNLIAWQKGNAVVFLPSYSPDFDTMKHHDFAASRENLVYLTGQLSR